MNGDGQELLLPPGFRFHPTDEELVNCYLCLKCAGQALAVPIVAEIDLYKFDPWELPELSRYGEKEWYFFSPRDRKYPNGSRPNRSAGMGYWKATGADKPIGKPKIVGIKKALVFYAGKAPAGVKTNWIMHEYRLANVDRSAASRKNRRLDDWVLCRIYNKKGTIEKPSSVEKRKVTIKHLMAEDTERPPNAIQGWPVGAYGETPGSMQWQDSMMRQQAVKESGYSEEEIVEPQWNCLDLDVDFSEDSYVLAPFNQMWQEQGMLSDWQLTL